MEKNIGWQELKIDNLPPDILTGDYEVADEGAYSSYHMTDTLRIILENPSWVFKYRKIGKEPKQPTHEEIMSLWWLDEYGDWVKVIAYGSEDEFKYKIHSRVRGNIVGCTKEWFTNRESADIPPEAV